MVKSNHKTSQAMVKIGLIVACVCTGLLASFFIYRFLSTKQAIRIQAQEDAVKTTKHAANRLDEYLKKLSTLADSIADDISSGKLPFNKIIERIKQKPNEIYGLGVVFIPFAFDQSQKLYAPYVFNKRGSQELIMLGDQQRYIQPERFAIDENRKPIFHEPFLGTASNATVIEYSTPFYNKKREVIGIVFANYSLEDFNRFEAELFPGNLSFAEVISDKGLFISTPDYELVEKKTNALVLQRGLGNFELADNVEKAINGKLEVFTNVNSLSGQKSLIIFEHMALVPWYTVGVFATAEIEVYPASLQRILKESVLMLILFFIFFVLILLAVYRGDRIRLWLGSCMISFGFIAAIIFLWYNAAMNVGRNYKEVISKNLLTEESIDKELGFAQKNSEGQLDKNSSLARERQDLMVTSTGIYLHELSVGVDKVAFSGYVWQQYPLKIANKFKPGVIFPQATDVTLKELYSSNEGDLQTKGWSVTGVLQQNFNYSEYPFDFQHIKIKLWPQSFDGDVMLVPDLNGYKVLNPTSLPGLNNQIRLQGWYLDHSYFSFRDPTVSTNFGIHSANTFILNNDPTKLKIPQLSFNIIVNRYVIRTLILSLLPIIIILVLLFIILLMSHLIQFSSAFTGIASLFFTSLISYTTFTNYIPIQQVVFFDYLYFLVQVVILKISILSILYYKKFNISFVRYKDLFIPQLLFWPLVTGAILVLSLVFFF